MTKCIDPEFEYVFVVPKEDPDDPRITIGISERDSGPERKAYGVFVGWAYCVFADGGRPIEGEMIEGEDLRKAGMPATHQEMALALCDIWSAHGEALKDPGRFTERFGESTYSPEAQAFLTANADRLAIALLD